MKDEFNTLLDKMKEVGYAEQVVQSIVYASGLPKVKPKEVVLFETGEVGQAISLSEEYVEIMLLSRGKVDVGTRVVRTGSPLAIKVGLGLLGSVVSPLGKSYLGDKEIKGLSEVQKIDIEASGIGGRKNINRPFETGVTIVDLIIPLGKGQRQLVVGDRKTGKTQLLLQSLLTQASKGTVCIYSAIAKRMLDIQMIQEFLDKHNIAQSTVLVATSSSDPPGLIFISPYAAMTIAEYFRDLGYDVLVIMDDLSAHAKYYREIMLLAKHFPGRSSYPGDIFYIHSRLMERAGNFIVTRKDDNGKLLRGEASITCLPVAELVLSDLSGYIQTNLMSMTDGHIFFDSDLYNQGRRPAINTFLSVTRVGRQAQEPLMRDINRQVTSFLVYVDKLKEFMHFGAELSESTQKTLAMGDRIVAFLDQPEDIIIPKNISVALLSGIWAGLWKDTAVNVMKRDMGMIIEYYKKKDSYKKGIDELIAKSESFEDVIAAVKENESILKIPSQGG